MHFDRNVSCDCASDRGQSRRESSVSSNAFMNCGRSGVNAEYESPNANPHQGCSLFCADRTQQVVQYPSCIQGWVNPNLRGGGNDFSEIWVYKRLSACKYNLFDAQFRSFLQKSYDCSVRKGA